MNVQYTLEYTDPKSGDKMIKVFQLNLPVTSEYKQLVPLFLLTLFLFSRVDAETSNTQTHIVALHTIRHAASLAQIGRYK